jgi:ATP-dependent exoDNAse (exonuclease V) beta subunit
LIEARIPVNLVDGIDFLKSTGVESVLAWMRLAVRLEHLAGSDIKLAARRPGRGISPKVREWMGEQTTVEGLDRLAARLDEKTSPKVVAFNRDIERIVKFAKRAATSTLIEFIRTDIGLDQALATLDASHLDQNGTSNSDSLRSLIALGRQHPDPSTFESWLKKMVAQAPDENGVVLATVHKVKGLEWPHVIVYDASEEVFPHRLSSDVEEERRIFHVAITRCVSTLTVTADASAPSIFLSELAAPGDPSQVTVPGPFSSSSAHVRSTGHQPSTSIRQPVRPTNQSDRSNRTSSTAAVKTGSVEWRAKVQSESPMAYEPWSKEEDESLKIEHSKGWSVARMAETHHRRPGAIRSRLKKLGPRD